jgi:hypothetical protein
MKSGFLFRELGGLIHASALYHEFRLEPLRVTNYAQGLKGMPGLCFRRRNPSGNRWSESNPQAPLPGRSNRILRVTTLPSEHFF